MKNKLTKISNNRLRCTYLMLFIYPLYNLITAFLFFKGVSINESLLMITMYFIVLIYGLYVIISSPIHKKSLVFIFFIYLFIIIMYFIADDRIKLEFSTTYMKIMYIYFIPLGVFIVSKVNNWEKIFIDKNYLFITDIIIILAFISKVVLNDKTDYMAFSYDLLPLWGIALISAIHYKHKFQWFISGIALLEAIIYGARGALIWYILCGILVFLIDAFYSLGDKRKFIRYIFITFFFIGVGMYVYLYLVPYLAETKLGRTSYILLRFNLGMLGESNARTDIFQICLNEIAKMGLNINGLYYDRLILPKGMYAHNIILESVLSLGWILGILFLFWIFSSILKSYTLQNNEGKIVTIFLTTVLFLRFFISGSIFGEGKFIIYISAIMSLNSICNRRETNE